jgi:anaerobic dimethyl sulfoxide reductase subunit A
LPASTNQVAGKEGKWITAACWHNCGSRCLNKAYVVDGVVIRQKTDDTHPDSPDYPQERACVRGRSQRNQVFGADRLKYPMRRKNWAPGGGNKVASRKDEWVRISWEEALDSIAGEIKRIKEHMETGAFFGNGRACIQNLSFIRGLCQQLGYHIAGTWTYTPDVIGYSPESNSGINDRIDMRNSETVIMFGMNPAWSFCRKSRL